MVKQPYLLTGVLFAGKSRAFCRRTENSRWVWPAETPNGAFRQINK
jgi:hypothetical protein